MRKKNYTRYVGVMVSEEIYDKLVSITDRQEIPLSEFLRDLIDEAIETREEDK